MKRLLLGLGLWGLVLGCASNDGEPCGSACDAQPSAAALQICAGKAEKGSQHGETLGVSWTDQVAFESDEVTQQCEKLCRAAAPCREEDEAACVAQCPSVAAQAREQQCEQSLMTPMRCLSNSGCSTFPTAAHPIDFADVRACDLAIDVVSCSLVLEGEQPSVLSLFSEDAPNRGLASAVGGSNDPHACARRMGRQVGERYETSLDVQCRRGDSAHWCCECNVDEQPVRAFAEDGERCPADDLESVVQICGWRF